MIDPTDIRSGIGRLMASGLVHRYGRRVALEGVSLRIDRPGIVALVGPNGAGKSTLIKIWAGLERPTAGTARVHGHDPWRERAASSSLVGYVPQTPALYSWLTIGDHLSLALGERQSFDRDLARAYLSTFRVPLEARAGELSGGQRAQVSLAIALATRAPVLLLDEPLASLDPLARRDFLGLLADDIAKSGATALLSSHIISDIEEVGTHLIVLGDGAVRVDGAIGELISRYETSALGSPLDAPGSIAEFVDRNRETRLLWPRGAAGPSGPRRAATLEEIVIGFLASDRRRSGAEAR